MGLCGPGMDGRIFMAGNWFGLVVGPPRIHGVRGAEVAGIGSPG